MKAITKRQMEILVFLREFRIKNGYQCSFQEIADYFGFKSNNSVTCHLKLLEKNGLIYRQTGRARSIMITREGLLA